MTRNFKLNEDSTILEKKREVTNKSISGLFLKLGIVRNVGQANILMVLIIVFGIAAIVFINARTFTI